MKKSIRAAYIVAMGNGLESFVFREVDESIKQGVDITLFATTYKPGDIFSPKTEWRLEVISYVKIILSLIHYLFFKPLNTLSIIVESLKYRSFIELLIAFDYSLRMKKMSIDHVHCVFGDRKFFVGYYCKRLLNLQLSVTIHAHEIYANPNRMLFEKCINGADKIVTISDENKYILINEYNVSPDKIKTIRLSIDLENFKKHKKIKILIVSRFEERKGFRELFDALNLLNSDDLEVVVIGFGELDVRGLVKEKKLDDQVVVFNKMSPTQLKFFYNNSDIFCLPSKHTDEGGSEGIPVVLMEAMASEMIVVTTSNGSIPELVDDILVREGDAIDLARGLSKAIALYKEDSKFGSKNRRKVLSEYSGSNITKLNEYLYGD
jgi:glycosyltransferase involved in cell wall biosynthesis